MHWLTIVTTDLLIEETRGLFRGMDAGMTKSWMPDQVRHDEQGQGRRNDEELDAGLTNNKMDSGLRRNDKQGQGRL